VSCTDDQATYSGSTDKSLIQAIRKHSPTGSEDYYLLPLSGKLTDVPQDPLNPLSPIKVALGKLLFYETGIAMGANNNSHIKAYSCASCHIPEAGFKPGFLQGIADGGMGFGVNGEQRTMHADYQENELDIQAIRPLSLLNVAFVENTFWNGQFGASGANIGTEDLWDNSEETKMNALGFKAIETQNIIGIRSHRFDVTKDLMDEYGYTEMFDAAFPEFKEEYRYSVRAASLAISAYIRTLISNEAPFQKWLEGNTNAMTESEKEGAILFFDKANCARCHYGKNLGSPEFHALGVKDMDQNPRSLNPDPTDKRHLGRGGFTLDPLDNYKFKVPGLYNISDTPFYFHGSSKTSLEDVIEYKIAAERENLRVPVNQMSTKFVPLQLSDRDKQNLLAFLSSGLRDPDLLRFKPDFILSGLCFPNNDTQSQIDLHCN
jgi:cytochrome c peroxidase